AKRRRDLVGEDGQLSLIGSRKRMKTKAADTKPPCLGGVGDDLGYLDQDSIHDVVAVRVRIEDQLGVRSRSADQRHQIVPKGAVGIQALLPAEAERARLEGLPLSLEFFPIRRRFERMP